MAGTEPRVTDEFVVILNIEGGWTKRWISAGGCWWCLTGAAGSATGRCGGCCDAIGGTGCGLWRWSRRGSRDCWRGMSLRGVDSDGPGTMLVVRDAGGAAEKVLVRSDAVVAVLRELPRPWPGVGVGLRWIPRAVRDLGYRLVARWRYRIWGRLESCPVPTAEERGRFL